MLLFKNKYKSKYGFTLIELLVVVAILGLLASIILIGVKRAASKAKTAKVKTDLVQLKKAILLLEEDTGKWPGGCNPNEIHAVSNPELDLDDAQTGLVQQPVAGDTPGPLCEWTALQVSNWKGQYIGAPQLFDPWGTKYGLDIDYTCTAGFEGCEGVSGTVSVIYSSGPNKSAINTYDADNIVSILYRP